MVRYLIIIVFLLNTGICYGGTIKIASFNIQVFGQSKANKNDVMDTIANILKQYDIIAIQEVRDVSGTAIKKLMAGLGVQYHYIIGPRLGRTSSKEQYVYIFKNDIKLMGRPYTYDDPLDFFHREPFIAYFKKDKFDFILINIHVDPDEATEEIYELLNVVIETREKTGEQDIIILGDLNADCNYFDENKKGGLDEENYLWVIKDWQDTNLSKTSCTYDRIIITKEATENDFTGVCGVDYFDMKYSMPYKKAKRISDHYPVWAEFHTGRDYD